MLITMVIALLLVIALLAIPLELRFQLSRYEVIEGDVTLVWLFGLLKVNLSKTKPQTKSDDANIAAKQNKRGSSSLSLSRALRQKPLRSRLIRFVRDIWHAIKREDFRLFIRLGLGDPSDTGLLWAIIGPLSGMLFAAEDADITIEPDFIESAMTLESSGKIRLIPLQLLYLIMGLLLSPALWRGLRASRNRGSMSEEQVIS